jgi:hypothetical protein
MANIEVLYGVCVFNDDPDNSERIRFYDVSLLENPTRTVKDIEAIIGANDNTNTYLPWRYSTGNKKTDPYLSEPFLPKFFNIVPNPGQLVKLIRYNTQPEKYEYVGPITTDIIQSKQSYYMGLQKSRPNNNGASGIVPDPSKFTINGKDNEQIILGGNSIIQRLDYFTSQKQKKDNYPFIQFVEFPSKSTIDTVTSTQVKEIDFSIDFVVSVKFDYKQATSADDKNLTCYTQIYDSKKIINPNGLSGLKKSMVTFTDGFRSTLNNPVITFTITTKSANKLIETFTDVLTSMKNQLIYKYPSNYNIEDFTYTDSTQNINIVNQFGFLPNDGGALPETPNTIVNNNFVVIGDITQVAFTTLSQATLSSTYGVKNISDDPEFLTIANFVSQRTYENFVTKLQNTSKVETTTSDTNSFQNTTDSVHIQHVDKILLYSTENDIPLVEKTASVDGTTQQKIAEIFKNSGSQEERFKLASPAVRGDKLLNILIRLIGLLLNHGHVAGVNVSDSLDETSRQELASIIQDLQKDLQDDKNSVTLNHYIRLN